MLLYLAVSVCFYLFTAKYTVYLAVSVVFGVLTAKYNFKNVLQAHDFIFYLR